MAEEWVGGISGCAHVGERLCERCGAQRTKGPDGQPLIGDPGEIVVMLIRLIKEKTPIRDVEFGYDEDDHNRWWAKATLRSGRVRMAEVQVKDFRLGPVQALAELGRELGLSIRIRDPIYKP